MKEPRDALITDHAIVRWLERHLGIDIRERVAAEMLGEGRDQMVRLIHNGRLRIAGTRTVLRIDGGKVVTVVLIEGKDKSGRKRQERAAGLHRPRPERVP